MSRKVIVHPGILYCSGCKQELKLVDTPLSSGSGQWIFACVNEHCGHHGEHLSLPVQSKVCLAAPKEV